jgi:predicted aconitase
MRLLLLLLFGVHASQVIGARTEKYADYIDILAAITGRVPNVGVHVERNRAPAIVIDATEVILNHLLPHTTSLVTGENIGNEAVHDSDDTPPLRRIRCDEDGIDSFFPIMGWICGNLSDGAVPLILGFDLLEMTNDNLKAFCASFGTTGSGENAKTYILLRDIVLRCS